MQQSTIYASQKNQHNFAFSNNCLKKLIRFLLLTGYHGLPQERMYWCEDEDIESDIVRACFSRNRYQEIKRNLHFNDSSNMGTGERARSFKIAPMMEKINEKFLMNGFFSKHFSIDEQMVQYYGHDFMQQFIRGKLIQFGYKNWAMWCSDTGYCFNFDMYEGKKATKSPISGLRASVVLNMIAKVNVPSDHIFYFDNFFTSFDLMKVLTERSISASGTVRINRTNKCPLSTDENLKKQDRGFYDYRMDSNSHIFAVVCKDNNNVKMLSNRQGTLPAQKVKRCSRQNKKLVTLNQPKCIADYNSHMGGVDKMDRLINKQRIKIQAKMVLSSSQT